MSKQQPIRPVRQPARELPPMTAADIAFAQAIVQRTPAWTPARLAVRLVGVAVVFSFMWFAIEDKGATAGALLLPTLAEIATAMLLGFVLVALVNDRAFRREILSGYAVWLLPLIAIAFWQWNVAQSLGLSFGGRVAMLWNEFTQYVRHFGMQWAMLAAAVMYALGTSADYGQYRRSGPPFIYVGSLTTGLRMLIVIVMGGLIFFVEGVRDRAQMVWLILLLAELASIALPALVRSQFLREGLERVASKSTAHKARQRDPDRRGKN